MQGKTGGGKAENNMYSLSELFKNSTHDDSIFSPETVSAIEAMIYTKESRGKITPFIKCIIRKKEIRLTPEEAVRQLYVYRLIHEYGYDPENIRLEHGINFGREVKRADIVIFEKDHPNSEYIIVEVKKPNSRDGKAQLKSYCNASGAIMGVWTNGQDFDYYRRKDPNYFEDIPDIPKAKQKLRDILKERWTISDLEDKDKLRDGKKSLTSLIQEMEDDVLAGAGVDVFEEVFKLIYTKLFDEMQSGRDKSRVLEFRNYGDTDSDLKANIQALFSQAMGKWPGVFNDNATISLTPSHLSVCVSALQEVKLFNSNLDVIDDAFEYLMSKSQKGEKGQFFTPRYVIDMCVKMLNPQKHESMIDTAAGSCGFPVHTIFHVWKNILAEKGIEQSHLFTAEYKPPECQDYVKDKVFAIDFDENAVRVARTLNLIAGDGRTNVIHLNTLDYGRWEETTKAEEWIDIYNDGWKGLRRHRKVKDSNADFMFDIVMANPPFAGDIKEGKIISRYELAKDSKGKYASKIGRDILFIERNIHFLKPGGRMAIILPQGRFNNSSDKYIRDFIARECRILAVIGLHENVFKPHTGTKTSVLFVQKWDDELCPKRDDYPVFFATMRKPGKDNSGDKIYVRDSEGRILRDAHYHPIVDHDLYNHDGLTQDGIAEAFIEFAKREGLSFFGDARFSEELYGELVSGLEVSEVMLSEIEASTDYFRLEAEYFNAKKLLLVNKLKGEEIISGIQYGTSKLCDENDNGYPVLRLNELDNGFIDIPKKFCHTLTDMEIETLSLKKGDMLVIRTNGNSNLVGRSAVVMEDTDYAFASYLFRVFMNGILNPCTVSAFMNGKYGRIEIDRLSMKGNQTNFSPAKFRDMIFPKIGHELQDMIQALYERAYTYRKEATQSYAQAQTLLNDAVHFTPSEMSASNTATVSFSQAFSTGRLDAEYFMPKYSDYERTIAEYPHGSATVRELFRHVKTSCPRTEEAYRYVEIGDIDIGTGTAKPNNIPTPELPDNAKIMTMAGDILVSKVRPNRGAVAILEEDNLLVSGAFTVLREKTDYRREVLQVLLRSEMYRDWLLRFNVGTSYPVIKDDDVLNMPVPLLPTDTQQRISEHVQRSFTLRLESERLISLAVKAVETAIEQGEEKAIDALEVWS